ncbi:MAG TPA: WbqC family protein [Vicinamibacterales bacterium]|nr:WbqC family protein [Vicinamibacterales bacterium]
MDKTLAVLQSGYLPWLGFFDQMRRADVFILYDDVQYDKHGWRNRNRIKTPSGPLWLTVPVRHSGLDWPRINQVEIEAGAPWARKHVASLKQYYARAPFTAEYLPALEAILMQPWTRLIDLNDAVMMLLAGWLGITTAILRSSAIPVAGEKSERLLELCRHVGATRYLSGDAAKDYLDVAAFASRGITVEWQQYEHPMYLQQHGAFISHLSVIDLVLNCGGDSAAVLRRSRQAEE